MAEMATSTMGTITRAVSCAMSPFGHARLESLLVKKSLVDPSALD
jgi:hypothetical protein